MTRKTMDPSLVAKAADLFATLKGLTSSPGEAMAIIAMLHISLWVQYADEGVTVDSMLDNYVSDFKHNLEKNVTRETLQ
jgi:hypothetical protein